MSEERKTLKCKLCGRSFSGIAMLRQHSAEHRSQISHCNTCGVNYRRNSYHRCR